jgi:DNA-binding NarL/FixJ family response regulator
VEDFERFRRFICSILQQRNAFQITEASDGLEALQRIQDQSPDLILLDIGLPRLNGTEVARRVRKLAPSSRILFLTQESSSDVVREALSIGALGYVHKSHVRTDLLPAIEAALNGKRFVSSSLDFSEATDPSPNGVHEILFCSDEAAIVNGLADFVGLSLNARNPVIVWATEPHRRALLVKLREHGVEVDSALERGTYISSDIDEPPDPARILARIQDLKEATGRAGWRNVRIAVCGERAGRLWSDARPREALLLEQVFSQLARSHDMNILCIYPSTQEHQDEEMFRSICAEHSGLSRR